AGMCATTTTPSSVMAGGTGCTAIWQRTAGSWRAFMTEEICSPQRNRGTEMNIRDELTEKIIGGAIEVHQALGPGLLESVYEECLAVELELRTLQFERQKSLSIEYKGREVGADLRIDLLVERRVIVELKSVEKLLPVHEAQLLTYLRLSH